MGVAYTVKAILGVRLPEEDYPQFSQSESGLFDSEELAEKGLKPEDMGKYDDFYFPGVEDIIIHQHTKQGKQDHVYLYIGKVLFKGNAIYEFEGELTFIEKDRWDVQGKLKRFFGIEGHPISVWITSQYD